MELGGFPAGGFRISGRQWVTELGHAPGLDFRAPVIVGLWDITIVRLQALGFALGWFLASCTLHTAKRCRVAAAVSKRVCLKS